VSTRTSHTIWCRAPVGTCGEVRWDHRGREVGGRHSSSVTSGESARRGSLPNSQRPARDRRFAGDIARGRRATVFLNAENLLMTAERSSRWSSEPGQAGRWRLWMHGHRWRGAYSSWGSSGPGRWESRTGTQLPANPAKPSVTLDRLWIARCQNSTRSRSRAASHQR
jgi:hypothetical protein